MIDLTKLQQEVYSNTIRLGYNPNKKETIRAVKRELREFSKTKKVLHKAINTVVSDTICDNQYKKVYDMHIKDKEECEIADIVFVLMSYCEQNGIDLETCLMNKKRYNDNRSPK